jgi:hypothetical protein
MLEWKAQRAIFKICTHFLYSKIRDTELRNKSRPAGCETKLARIRKNDMVCI